MFLKKGNKRQHMISSSVLDDIADKSENEHSSFIINTISTNNCFISKTPEINRNASKDSNQSTPLVLMPLSVEKTTNATPPAVCMTSTPKVVEPEELDLSKTVCGEFVKYQQAASPTCRKRIQMTTPFRDSFLQNQSSISDFDEVRPIGTYSISMLEEEYENLLVFIKEEREKNVHQISSLIQAMKDRVDRLASDLEDMLNQRFQTIDQHLQEAIENFEEELKAGKAIQDEVHTLRQKINTIVNEHLQTPTKRI